MAAIFEWFYFVIFDNIVTKNMVAKCFPIERQFAVTFHEIGRMVRKLQNFSYMRWRPPPSWISPTCHFGQNYWIVHNQCFSPSNLEKIGSMVKNLQDLTEIQDVVRGHLELCQIAGSIFSVQFIVIL